MAFPKELPVPFYANGTQPVGTPVKVFEPFTTPEFNTPSIPVGGIITDIRFQNTSGMSQAAIPFAIGHNFKKGQVSKSSGLIGSMNGMDVRLQMVPLASWDDGSVRHASVAGVLPTIGAGEVKMDLKRTAGPLSEPIAPVSFDKLARVTVKIGDVLYTAESDLVYLTKTIVSGPLFSEVVLMVPLKTADGVAHPVLMVQFRVRVFHTTGKAEVRVTVEHCQAYASFADITYAAEVFMEGVSVYSKIIVHTATGRWTKKFWKGQPPAICVKHNSAYLIESVNVSNYDQTIKADEATMADWAIQVKDENRFGPMGWGRWQPSMGTTGGRPDIGLLPDSYALALVTMRKEALDMMYAQADCAGSWPAHRRDDGATSPAKGEPLDIFHYPCSSLLGNPGDCQNYKTGKNEKLPLLSSATIGQPDISHQPSIAYLPYLLTADYYYLEELLFWTNFDHYSFNPGYRMHENGYLSPDQVRAQGWALRNLGHACAITPDSHPAKQGFIFLVENNMKWYIDFYIVRKSDGLKNELGVATQNYMLEYNGGVALAPWQDDHFTSGIGLIVDLLGYESAKTLLRWKSKWQLGRMNEIGAIPAYACNYYLNARPTTSSALYPNLDELFKASIPASQRATVAVNSAENDNRFDDPSYSYLVPDGYPDGTAGYMANYQPALAFCADLMGEEGKQAWKRFMARTPKPNYGLANQFAIVPRFTTATVVVQPVPEPAPAPAPAPTPAPAPMPAPLPKPGTIKSASNVKLKGKKGLRVTVFAPTTLGAVHEFAGVTASTKGGWAVTDVSLAPGTQYAARVEDATGVLDVMFPLKAA